VVAGMVAGADSIDDLGLLLHGACTASSAGLTEPPPPRAEHPCVLAFTPAVGHLVSEDVLMGRQRREFTPEYKGEAVRLVINTSRAVATVNLDRTRPPRNTRDDEARAAAIHPVRSLGRLIHRSCSGRSRPSISARRD